MAITKVSGETLESNLIRTQDLAFNTNLLYVDVANGRIGVNTDSPGNFALDVNGNTRITGDLTVQGTTTTIDSQNLTVEDNIITLNDNASGATDAGIMINRTTQNNAVFFWDETLDKFKVGTTPEDGSTRTDFTNVTLSNLQVATPMADEDAVTKLYLDDSIATLSSSGIIGTNVRLGTPDDSTFGDGAYQGLNTVRSVTDAIDDLNETMENIRAGTYVKSVTYTATPTAGSLGTTVTLSIVAIGGGADRYEVDWGDGTVTTETVTNPTHAYNENSGQPYTISVKAYANGASTTDSAGSFANSGDFQTNQVITIYTAQPVANFEIRTSATRDGGSVITTADSGDTVYLQNKTTNTAGATVTYDVDWGDGTSEIIAGDSVDGGVSGNNLSHTYTNSAGDDGSTVAGTGAGDTKYQIRLRLLTHSTADPGVIPSTATANFEVYSTHTVAYSVADSTIRGVNEEATAGFPVTFTNDTATNPGNNSDFSATQRYTWNFGEGDDNTTVNVGSGSPGDTGQTISNTFNLSSGEQSAGTTVT